MTKLLQQAFERASELPETEQDKFARFLLAELESEREWNELFSPARVGGPTGAAWPMMPCGREHRAGLNSAS